MKTIFLSVRGVDMGSCYHMLLALLKLLNGQDTMLPLMKVIRSPRTLTPVRQNSVLIEYLYMGEVKH